MMPVPFVITRRTEEFPGTITLQLRPQDHEVTPFIPGQFNMLYAFGDGEVPISLSGPQENGSYVHTLKALGSATRNLAKLGEGDSLGLRGPFGNGWPLQLAAGRNLIIIAGGLGLAPLRPAIYSLLSGHYEPESVQLLYGAKNPGEILYRDEIEQWSAAFSARVTVDTADDGWKGHIGNVNSLLTSTTIVPENTLCFVCGPEVMMRFVIRELLKKEIPPASIYLSMERNMQCATGHCGHCQWGPRFICKDGPVFCYQDIQDWFYIREL